MDLRGQAEGDGVLGASGDRPGPSGRVVGGRVRADESDVGQP
jgi:hypothetical protein